MTFQKIQTAQRKKILWEKYVRKEKIRRLKKADKAFVFKGNCLECKSEFTSKCSRSKYCGKACKKKYEGKYRIRKTETRICLNCQGAYTVRKDAKNRVCGRVCGGKYSQKKSM